MGDDDDRMLLEALGLRETPKQARSRGTVLAMLDHARAIVQAEGVLGLTTQRVAELAEVPIGSVYRYFADRDALLTALAAQDRYEMDSLLLQEVKRIELFGWRDSVRRIIADVARFARERPGYLELRGMVPSQSLRRDEHASWARWVRGVLETPAAQATGVSTAQALRHASIVVGAVQGLLPTMYGVDEEELALLIDEATRLVVTYLEDVAARLGIPIP